MKVNSRSKQTLSFIILIIGIIVGLAFILYPFFSQLYYDRASGYEVNDFRQELAAIDPPELKEKNVQLAEAYNEALDPNLPWIDPYSYLEREEGVKTYAKMLEVKERIGIIKVPKINTELSVYAGTSESVLQRGVGHLEGTSLPVGGKNTHSVLTAHRGLPEARLFTDLDKMEMGDIFSAETMAGELFYVVDDIKVVEPTDIQAIQLVADKDYMTLLTCTPYMINSHRLLVRGHRIPAPEKEDISQEAFTKGFAYYLQTYWYYFTIIIIALALVVYLVKR